MADKIKFKDLSGWLKALVIIGWIFCGFSALIYLISFLIGFFSVY